VFWIFCLYIFRFFKFFFTGEYDSEVRLEIPVTYRKAPRFATCIVTSVGVEDAGLFHVMCYGGSEYRTGACVTFRHGREC